MSFMTSSVYVAGPVFALPPGNGPGSSVVAAGHTLAAASGSNVSAALTFGMVPGNQGGAVQSGPVVVPLQPMTADGARA